MSLKGWDLLTTALKGIRDRYLCSRIYELELFVQIWYFVEKRPEKIPKNRPAARLLRTGLVLDSMVNHKISGGSANVTKQKYYSSQHAETSGGNYRRLDNIPIFCSVIVFRKSRKCCPGRSYRNGMHRRGRAGHTQHKSIPE